MKKASHPVTKTQEHSDLEQFRNNLITEVRDGVIARNLQEIEYKEASVEATAHFVMCPIRKKLDEFITNWWAQFKNNQTLYDKNPERGPNVSQWLKETYATDTLANVDLSHCNLRAANLQGITFDQVKFYASDLEGVEFFKCTFIRIEDIGSARNLTKASFNLCLFEACKLTGMCFDFVRHCIFSTSELRLINFSTSIIDVKFKNVILDPASFRALFCATIDATFDMNNLWLDLGKPTKFKVQISRDYRLIVDRASDGIDMEYLVENMPLNLLQINYVRITKNKDLQKILKNAVLTSKGKKDLMGYDFSRCDMKYEDLHDCDFRFSKFGKRFLDQVYDGDCKVEKTTQGKYDLRKIDLSGAQLEGVALARFDLSEASLVGSLINKNNLLSIIRYKVRLTIDGKIDLSDINIGRKGKGHKIQLTKEMDMSNCSFNGAHLSAQNLKQLITLQKAGHAPLTVQGKINIIGAIIEHSELVKFFNEKNVDLFETDASDPAEAVDEQPSTNTNIDLKSEEEKETQTHDNKRKEPLSSTFEIEGKRAKGINANCWQSSSAMFRKTNIPTNLKLASTKVSDNDSLLEYFALDRSEGSNDEEEQNLLFPLSSSFQ